MLLSRKFCRLSINFLPWVHLLEYVVSTHIAGSMVCQYRDFDLKRTFQHQVQVHEIQNKIATYLILGN